MRSNLARIEIEIVCKLAEIEIKIDGRLEPGIEIEVFVVSLQKLRSIAWYHNW